MAPRMESGAARSPTQTSTRSPNSERAFSSLRTRTRGRILRSNNCLTTRDPTSPVAPVIKYVISLLPGERVCRVNSPLGNKAKGKERFVYSHRAQRLTHEKSGGCRRNINESSHLRLHSGCETEGKGILRFAGGSPARSGLK